MPRSARGWAVHVYIYQHPRIKGAYRNFLPILGLLLIWNGMALPFQRATARGARCKHLSVNMIDISRYSKCHMGIQLKYDTGTTC